MTWSRRVWLALCLTARIFSGKVPGDELEAEVRRVREEIGRECRVCGRSKPYDGPCGYCPPEWQRDAS